MKKPKIGIIGYFGFGNAGDEAMRDIVLKKFPGAVASKKNKIEKCDAYIIAGGDLVQDFDGLYMPNVWRNIKNEPCYAISLGARKGWEKYRPEVVEWLNKFRIIYTREQGSYDSLSQYVKVDGVMPDLVLLADAPASKKKYPILFNYTDRKWLEPNGQFENIVNNTGALPIALSKEIFDKKYSNRYMTHQEFISAAKSSKGVIAVRLHGIVMGVIAGVPVAGISYEDKVKKFCQRYDIPVFDYGKENGKEIINSMRLAQINLPDERKKILNVIKEIKIDLAKTFSVR